MFPGYNTGTATLTVGSAVMTGQGTLWVGNVRPGDQVIGQDGSVALIASVDSNTQITLTRPWRGAAQAAAGYDILYTSDDVFAQALGRQVLQQISGSAMVGLSNVTPAARKLPFFDATSSAALADLTDKARALLGQVDEAAMRAFLSLVPQTSPTDATAGRLLQVGSFGIGKVAILTSPDLNSARPGGRYYCNNPTNGPGGNGWLDCYDLDADYAFQQYRDLSGATWTRIRYAGTWSAWKRLDTEVGINASGIYWRLNGGLQICRLVTSVSPTSIGTLSWTYPAAFSEKPHAFMAMEQGGSTPPTSQASFPTYQGNSTSAVTFTYTSPSTVTAILTSIGRWA